MTLLHIIDTLCDVTTKQADLLRELVTDLEHMNQVSEEVKKFFGSKVFKTVVPRNVRLSEAPSHGKPILAYDRLSRGAEAYGLIADEFLKRNKGGR